MARAYFLLFGLIGITGLLGQYYYFPSLLDYLSLFTLLSGILSTSALLYIGVNKSNNIKNFNFLFGAFTTYTLIAFLGYWVFLKDEPVEIPWINIVLHIIIPLSSLIGWVIYRHSLSLKYTDALKWLTFPVLYFVYVTVRNIFTGWSPYSFFDPNKVGGYGGVLMYAIALLTLTYIIGVGMIFINNKLLARRIS